MKISKDFKERLMVLCRSAIEQRIESARAAMLDAQESANSEEKSSAGDKYETARAMGQINRDRCARQMDEAMKELARLERIDISRPQDTAGTGALVVCENHIYFIASAVGLLSLDDMKVHVLSPAAPLAQQLSGKKKGERFVFNGNAVQIREVI